MASQGVTKPTFNTTSGVKAPNIPEGGLKYKYESTSASDILGAEKPTMEQVDEENYEARVVAIETFVAALRNYVNTISPKIEPFVNNHNAAVNYNESIAIS